MAKKDDQKQKAASNRKVSKLANFVQSSLDKLYQNTYYTQSSNKHDLDSIQAKLDASIDSIVSNNKEQTGNSSLSTLYSRIQKSSDDPNANVTKDLESLLNDANVLDAGMLGFINDTTTIFDYDNKIDTCIKYMPKLKEALDCRKDNVLSADHFSKDFINVTDESLTNNKEASAERIKEIKEKYDFLELAEKIYDKTSRYGEQFVYCVPAKKAISKLLKNKRTNSSSKITRGDININEGCIYTEGVVVEELNLEDQDFTLEDIKSLGIGEIKVELDKSCMISSVVENVYVFNERISSINESALNEAAGSKKDTTVPGSMEKRKRFDKTIDDENLSFKGFDDTGNEGLIIDNEKNSKDSKVEIPGTIVKLLKRKQVIPIYIEEHCFGYYYIETDDQYNPIGDYDRMQDPTMSLKGSNSILSTNSAADQSTKQNHILRYLSQKISSYIDSEFVNLNQDLRDEIYMILKHNDQNNLNRLNKLRVTFIPPEDMEHVYWELNEDTHRGISDLHDALFPATLYSAMYITNCIMTMTRSQDKRVYYVKQNVDTNISKTLLTTINQIKKGNMNIRQIENINHIMSITGRFNDYVIPRNSSGESPIDFEVLQGQTVEFKTELMTILEEMAINSTDVPMEIIQMRQSAEFATQLTMSSSKFLKKVYNRQAKYDKFLTRIFNKIYTNEYNDGTQHKVKLPPPMFLNITNTNQMINNVTDYSASIADIMLSDIEDENIKKSAIRDINLHYLGSYLDVDSLEETIRKAKQTAAKDSNEQQEE